jgi:putative phage-type endonuclease
VKIIDCIQGSPEWHGARAGRVTASRIADLTAKTKSGWGASRANYMAELVAERLTGKVAESYTNAAMAWGTAMEPEARSAYQLVTGAEVTPVGFVIHPGLEMAGASPDGLVADDGLLEVKCPNTATHIETLLSDAIPDKYIKQMQWQIACTGRAWCDFVSHDPRLPGRMQLFIRRVMRDPGFIIELEKQVVDFLVEVDATVTALSQKFNLKDAA